MYTKNNLTVWKVAKICDLVSKDQKCQQILMKIEKISIDKKIFRFKVLKIPKSLRNL